MSGEKVDEFKAINKKMNCNKRKNIFEKSYKAKKTFKIALKIENYCLERFNCKRIFSSMFSFMQKSKRLTLYMV